MRDFRIASALLFSSSLFIVHCSSADDEAPKNMGAAGTSTGMAGTVASAGKSGSSGTAGTGGSVAGMPGASGSIGQAGTTGMTAGQGGAGGVATGGVGGTSGGMAGTAGRGTAGTGMAGRGMAGAGGAAAGMGGADVGMGGKAGGAAGTGGSAGGGAFTLTSTVITEGGMFPDTNTCAGDNKSPDLTWTAGPSGTMSYAVILLDTANSLNHWVMWDIPSTVTTLPAALDTAAMPAVPSGAKQKSFQGNGYQGPCPSGADHLYKFTVYALPTATLSGMTNTQTAAAMSVMSANPLASASLSAHSTASSN